MRGSITAFFTRKKPSATAASINAGAAAAAPEAAADASPTPTPTPNDDGAKSNEPFPGEEAPIFGGGGGGVEPKRSGTLSNVLKKTPSFFKSSGGVEAEAEAPSRK